MAMVELSLNCLVVMVVKIGLWMVVTNSCTMLGLTVLGVLLQHNTLEQIQFGNESGGFHDQITTSSSVSCAFSNRHPPTLRPPRRPSHHLRGLLHPPTSSRFELEGPGLEAALQHGAFCLMLKGHR